MLKKILKTKGYKKKKKRKEKAKWKSHFTCIGIYRKEGWKHIHQNKYMVYFWVGGL